MSKLLKKIIYEKTSTLLKSNIIVAKQSSKEITESIKKTISIIIRINYFIMKIIVL
jgi:dihydrofolate synthase/folylpolyglutamate synthase